MDSMIGKMLGQYQIIAELGRGGMAIVYQAYQPNLERHVALKVLPPQFIMDAEFVRRFQNEARAAAKLKHSNIVTIYDVGEQDGVYYIVEELVEGVTLSELIRRNGPFPLGKSAAILAQVASALDYAHSLGYVHRDVKPSNIIVGANDHATLTDFGIAKAAEGTRVTRTGMLIGTPEYMSPEQIRGQAVDARADVYSLGIVCYEMLTGSAPFVGDTARVLYAQVNEVPPPLHIANSRLTASVDPVLGTALAKDRAQRYPTAGKFANALQAVARDGTPVPLRPDREPTRSLLYLMRHRPAGGWTYAILAGAILLTVLLISQVVLSFGFKPDGTQVRATAPATSTGDYATALVIAAGPSNTPPGLFTLTLTATPIIVVVTATSVPTITPRPATRTIAIPTRVEPTATPTLAPPGGKIAFSLNRGEYNNDKEIWVMNADGSNARRILNTASGPTFSPDGSRIAFYRWGDGIYIASADGSNMVKVSGNSNVGLIEWSHKSNWLAYTAWPPGPNVNKTVDLIVTNGQERRTLLIGENPSWSPDDTMLAFNTCAGASCGIFKANSSGGPSTPVVTDDGSMPAWSPDGQKILYQREVDGQRQIFVVNPDGTGKRQLTSGSALHVDAAWSPDGNYIFYRTPESGSWGIWRMSADGSNPVKLIDNVPPVFWAQEKLAITR